MIGRTYGNLALRPGVTGDAWVLSELEPHVVIRLKQLFPKIGRTAEQPFVLAGDMMTSADLHWFLSRYPLAAPANDLDVLESRKRGFEAHVAEMERILAPDYVAPPLAGLRPGQAIRGYQAQAIQILDRSGGLLLGDEVGLGKTFTACGACLTPGALPATIVCHPHLQQQWVRVVEEFTTLKAHAVRATKPYALPPVDVRVFRYSQLRGWADVLTAFGCGLVVFDEIQELRTGTASEKGHAAKRLAQTARRRLGLSATPIYNYGSEIYTIMGYIDPAALGDYGSFEREWAPRGRLRDPKALGTYLRERHVFLRRTKHDVGQDVPAINRIVDVVDYDQAALDSIEKLARQLALKATRGSFVERGQAARELDLLARQQTGVAKAKAVAAVARIMVEGGEPIVLVGWHREVYEIWNAALHDLKPAMYTGSETASQKAANVDRFLNGDTDILIMSLRSGAGLDGLQRRCSTMVFGELDWSPGVHHQCIGRLDREGQTSPVTALFLVAEEGSDPPMMEVLGLKASQASQILDPTLGVQTAHSDASVLQRLVERYLAKGSTHAVRREASGV